MVFASIRRFVGDPSAVARRISGLAASLGLSLCLGLAPLQAASAIPPQAGYISELAGPQALRAVLSTALPADLRTFGVGRDDLERFYAQRDFAPLFITETGWRPDTVPTLALMQAAGAHGLKPVNYWDDALADRLGLVLANLERLRWEERLVRRKHVRVNIANFHLVAREGEEDRLSMPVVVGRNSRRTPVISDQIVSLKFSPDWTVPRSILEKDYLSRLRADPGFAIDEGFEVYQNGALISPYRVQWHDPRISRKVTLRKPPSSYGPLGGVRFSLTNDMAIFLHDTPSTDLFDLSQRAHSSGCVRVAEPEALAAYLLEGTSWDDQRISRAMLAGSIQIAKPVEPVQVFLSYMTAFVGADGRLQVVSDPYQLDEDLISRLM